MMYPPDMLCKWTTVPSVLVASMSTINYFTTIFTANNVMICVED